MSDGGKIKQGQDYQMKISIIKDCLDNYVANAGVVRTYIKNEPHINKLQEFYKKIKGKDRDLTSEEQLRVVIIALGKRNTNGTQSCITFDELFRHLGSKEAFEYLFERGQLTEANVLYIEKYKHIASSLSQFIVLVSEGIPSAETILAELMANVDLSNIGGKLKDIESLVKAKMLTPSVLMLLAKSEAYSGVSDILFLLYRHGLYKEENIARLSKNIMSFLNIRKILLTLEEASPELMLQSNVTPILELDLNLYRFSCIIEELHKAKELKQGNLKTLFSYTEALKKGSWLKEILSNFSQGGWDIEQNLEAILATGDEWDIKTATDDLLKLKLNPAHVKLVLDVLFKYPQQRYQIISGIETLLKAKLLDDNNLTLIFSVPQYANRLAKAMQLLKDIPSEHAAEVRKIVCATPSYADDLVVAFKELLEVGQFTPLLSGLVIQHPKSAEIVANILKRLRQNNLCGKDKIKSEDNIKLLYEKNLTNGEFNRLLFDLEQANLLNQTNLDKISEHSAFIKTLSHACTCLANGKKLDQENFDALLDEPIEALSIAKLLGGRSRPSTYNLPDKGAKVFTEIRNAACILAVTQKRSHAFFPEIKSRDIELFNKKLASFNKKISKNELLEQQKEALIKIAKMCGDGVLESETEQRLAEDAYCSINPSF